IVERLAQRNRSDHGGLAVVLVVEGAYAAAAFEAVGVVDGPVVHLRPLLLSVVDDIEAGALLEAERVEAGPALDLGLLLFAEGRVTQQVEELLVVRNRQPLAPGAGFLEFLVVERLAGIGFDAPAGLVERSDLVGQQRLVIQLRRHTDASSLAWRAASPSRRTFSSATTVGR